MLLLFSFAKGAVALAVPFLRLPLQIAIRFTKVDITLLFGAMQKVVVLVVLLCGLSLLDFWY